MMTENKVSKHERDDTEVIIEHALPQDAEAMMRLKRAAWAQAYPSEEHGVTNEDVEKKFTEEDVLEGARNWEKGIAGEPHDGKRQTFVARINNKVAGFTSPCYEDEQWRIGQLYVDPEFQGQGIGSNLLKTALDWLGNEKDVYLHVLEWNNNAIDLYEKFNFVKTGKKFPAEVDEQGRKLLPEIEMLRRAKID
jgi:ribosomal protein S18 acetylase RimI-like enzyme